MKKFYESRTIIFFALFALVQVAGLVGFADYTPSGDEAEWVQLGVALIGMVLRAITKDAVEL